MKKEGNVLLHIEVEGDTFQLKVEGNSGDLVAALLYACREEYSLSNVFQQVVKISNDEDFQKRSDAFYNTQGDA
jgi:hypothetical protein